MVIGWFVFVFCWMRALEMGLKFVMKIEVASFLICIYGQESRTCVR
jgi:hypothetical protein